MWFLGAAALLNVGLDLLFVLVFSRGIAGAAIATVLAQYVSGIGILIYAILKCREFLPGKDDRTFSRAMLAEILDLSLLYLRAAVGDEFSVSFSSSGLSTASAL